VCPRNPQSQAPSRRLAAIIVHHGDPAPTLRALASVVASREVEVLAVVVDHGPGPGDSLVRAAEAAGAVYVRPESNLGFAGGLNRGIGAARERGPNQLYLLLNHDVVLDQDAASILARRLEARPDAGIVGPALLDGSDPRRIWNAGSEIDWPRGRPRSLLHDRPAAELPAEPCAVGFVCGCAAMIHVRLLDRIGSLSEDYFLYFEDADLSFRARRAGLAVEVDPRARAIHFAGSATAGRPGLAAYCRARNRILFSRRFAPPGPRPRLRRLAFAFSQVLRGGPAGRGALAGMLGRSGLPPSNLV
jgi:GT2 family glycosyltransferase